MTAIGNSHNSSELQNDEKHFLPVRVYFILLYLVVLCFLFPIVSWYFFQKTNSFRDIQLQEAVTTRTQALEEKARYLTRSFSHSGTQSISEYNFSFFQNVLQEAVNSESDLLGCHVLSKASDNTALAELGVGDKKLLPYILAARKNEESKLEFPQQLHMNTTLPIIQVELNASSSNPFPSVLFIAPIYVGGTLWGSVNTIFSLENLRSDIQKIENDWHAQMQQYKISLFSLACIFVFLGILSAYLYTRPLITGLYSLRDGVNLVSKGDLDHQINMGGLRITELANLSQSFNTMTANLRLSRKKLDDYSNSLEEKVDERTQELREMQAELLNQAHEAGMAEMAVGVLHNIGNAITPAKVGAVVLSKELSTSPLRSNLDDSLSMAAKIIQEAPDIPQSQREQLTTILALLPDSIKQEYDRSVEALQGIITKHNYIEEIIHLQMHYAKLQGTAELVDINTVIQDGLKMMEDMISKYKISVTTDLQDVPKVQMIENKLLQILTNLFKNSCEAMENTREAARELAISTFQETAGAVVLTVKDAGCGFDPQIQKQLFSFGFSTKERGSGYGLHSCANYLIANNGSIEAFSEGPQQGAEFTIRLQPVELVE